jgi:hypothetical protein
MIDVMHYTVDQATLLQKIFRHKIVHLAMPLAVIEYDSKNIGWKYYHQNRAEHLSLKKFPATKTLQVTPLLSIDYDYEFVLGIKDFQEDIVNSVVNRGGYLDLVRSTNALQNSFETAATQMYDPAV